MKISKLYQKIGDNLIDLDEKYVTQKMLNDNYVTNQGLKNYALKKITSTKYFYIGGENASDTLDEGRGETTAKPFATLSSLLNYINSTYFFTHYAIVYIVLRGDITVPANFYFPKMHCYLPRFASYASLGRMKITFEGNSTFPDTCVDFINVELETNGTIRFDSFRGRSVVRFQGASKIVGKNIVNDECVVRIANGSLCIINYETIDSQPSLCEIESDGDQILLCADRGSKIIVNSDNLKLTKKSGSKGVLMADRGSDIIFSSIATLSGTSIGTRYVATNSSRIITGGKGANFIPGTINGTCDASSTYA